MTLRYSHYLLLTGHIPDVWYNHSRTAELGLRITLIQFPLQVSSCNILDFQARAHIAPGIFQDIGTANVSHSNFVMNVYQTDPAQSDHLVRYLWTWYKRRLHLRITPQKQSRNILFIQIAVVVLF